MKEVTTANISWNAFAWWESFEFIKQSFISKQIRSMIHLINIFTFLFDDRAKLMWNTFHNWVRRWSTSFVDETKKNETVSFSCSISFNDMLNEQDKPQVNLLWSPPLIDIFRVWITEQEKSSKRETVCLHPIFDRTCARQHVFCYSNPLDAMILINEAWQLRNKKWNIWK